MNANTYMTADFVLFVAQHKRALHSERFLIDCRQLNSVVHIQNSCIGNIDKMPDLNED